ncbi:MAG: amidohydrolase [Bacteroidales bacterium]|nr:amidohydrolase [Bacteroidales bacterium]MBR5029286.1 amidohydrolase [Bacteroidales bacterium]
MIDKIKQLASENYDDIIAVRRHLHQFPELSQEEFKTMEFVAERLREYGLNPVTGIAKTGVVALIEGRNPSSYCIALRADYDALPLEECTGLPFASENKGVMHACGHDMHTSSLLGAAKILSQLKDSFEGTVMLIFQPSEEKYPGGAFMMLQDGIFDKIKPSEIYSFHCLPEMDCGKIGMRKGKYMASTDELYLTVKGRGGHGGTPNLDIDPIVIASHIIVAMQQIVSRNANPIMPTILSFGKMIGNGRTNIIPDEVKIEGTIRTFDEEWRLDAHRRITRIAQGVAESMGGSCDVFIDFGYPYVFNDDDCTQRTHDNGVEYFGSENVEWLDMRMTAEDFAFFAQKVPACYYRIGVHIPGTPITNLHRPNLMIDEKSIEYAMGFIAYNAINALKTKSKLSK